MAVYHQIDMAIGVTMEAVYNMPEVYNLQKCREAPLGKKISTLRADLGKNIRTWRFFENIDKICDFLKLFMKDLEFLKDCSLKLQ